MHEIGIKYDLDAAGLCNDWVAFSTQNGDCKMETEFMDRWEGHLHSSRKKTPLSRHAVSKTGNGVMYTGENLVEL